LCWRIIGLTPEGKFPLAARYYLQEEWIYHYNHYTRNLSISGPFAADAPSGHIPHELRRTEEERCVAPCKIVTMALTLSHEDFNDVRLIPVTTCTPHAAAKLESYDIVHRKVTAGKLLRTASP
jgi:hypothetical protein